MFWPTLFGFEVLVLIWHLILESVLSAILSPFSSLKITDSPNLLSTYETCTLHFFKEKTSIFSAIVFLFLAWRKKRVLFIFIRYTDKVFSSYLIIYPSVWTHSSLPCPFSSKFKNLNASFTFEFECNVEYSFFCFYSHYHYQ